MSLFLSSSLSLGLDDHLQKNSYRAFFIRSKRSRDSEKEYFLARDCLSFVRTPVTKSINGISFNAYRKIVRIAKKMRIWNFFFFQITFPVSECATQLLIDIYQVASWNKTTAKISTQIFTQAFFLNALILSAIVSISFTWDPGFSKTRYGHLSHM